MSMRNFKVKHLIISIVFSAVFLLAYFLQNKIPKMVWASVEVSEEPEKTTEGTDSNFVAGSQDEKRIVSERPDNYGSAELGEYKGISVHAVQPVEVTDEDVERLISRRIIAEKTSDDTTEKDLILKISDGKCENLDAYRLAVRKELEEAAAFNAALENQENAIKAVVKETEFICNQDAILYEYYYERDYFMYFAMMQGMSLEAVASSMNLSYEELNARFMEDARSTVEQTIVQEEIFENEDMKLTDEDYDYLTRVYGQEEDLLKYNDQRALDTMAKAFKVNRFILDNANLLYD